MSIVVHYRGDLCNNLLEYSVAQFLSKKFNLVLNADIALGDDFLINKCSGLNTYNNYIEVNDNNILEIFNKSKEDINCGLSLNGFFQQKEIFGNEEFKNFIKECIIPKPLNTADTLVHIRLGDVEQYCMNLPYEYYHNQLLKINYQNIIIATDSPESVIIQRLLKNFPNSSLIDSSSRTYVLRYAMHAKNLVIGAGSFGFCMAFFSQKSTNVYCINHEQIKNNFNVKIWDGDMIESFRTRENTYFYQE
jgi:hypothetical protein